MDFQISDLLIIKLINNTKKCQCVKNTCGQPRMFNTRQIKIGAKYQFSNGVDGVAGIGAIVQAVCPSNSMLKCDGNKAWLFDILTIR